MVWMARAKSRASSSGNPMKTHPLSSLFPGARSPWQCRLCLCPMSSVHPVSLSEEDTTAFGGQSTERDFSLNTDDHSDFLTTEGHILGSSEGELQ